MTKDIRRFEYETVDSTNTEAKNYALRTDRYEPALFVSHEQTGGRGRLGRSFLSRKNHGIYMSLVYFGTDKIADTVSITTAAAVFVASAIESVTGKELKIKWVNDIYDDRGKVAGILTETLPIDDRIAVIVGVGINTGEGDFPEELRDIASSIGEITEQERGNIIEKTVSGLIGHLSDPTQRGYMSEYRQRSMLFGENVDLFRAGERVASGKVLGVSDDGGLIFLADGEIESETICTGEVSVRKKK